MCKGRGGTFQVSNVEKQAMPGPLCLRTTSERCRVPPIGRADADAGAARPGGGAGAVPCERAVPCRAGGAGAVPCRGAP